MNRWDIYEQIYNLYAKGLGGIGANTPRCIRRGVEKHKPLPAKGLWRKTKDTAAVSWRCAFGNVHPEWGRNDPDPARRALIVDAHPLRGQDNAAVAVGVLAESFRGDVFHRGTTGGAKWGVRHCPPHFVRTHRPRLDRWK